MHPTIKWKQNKKGNIDIIEYNDVANQLNFYQVYPAQKEKDTINTDIVDSEFQNPFEKEVNPRGY